MIFEAVVSAISLQVTRQLAGLVLKHEREACEIGGAMACGVSSELEASCRAIPAEELLKAIRRHRLETLLAADPIVLQLIPELADRLKVLAHKEHMAALALASLTREMAALFERAGIPMLVIKGVPLALQTTGLLTARGHGDLDLLVDPSQVGEAIHLLKREGFFETYGPNCLGHNTTQGHYSRWVTIELSFVRRNPLHQWIDLHWHPSHVRGVFPRFKHLWLQRCSVVINDQTVATLPTETAFIHACCHAMVDRWMCLRNLVDVERLSRTLEADGPSMRLRSVRKTCCVAAELTGSDRLIAIAKRSNSFQTQKVLRLAHAAQAPPVALLKLRQGWTPRNRILYALHQLNLSHHPCHWLSMAMQHTVPPRALVDRQGRYCSAWGVMSNRFAKLAWRISAVGGEFPPPHGSEHPVGSPDQQV